MIRTNTSSFPSDSLNETDSDHSFSAHTAMHYFALVLLFVVAAFAEGEYENMTKEKFTALVKKIKKENPEEFAAIEKQYGNATEMKLRAISDEQGCWGCCGLCERVLTAGWHTGCTFGSIVAAGCGPWKGACQGTYIAFFSFFLLIAVKAAFDIMCDMCRSTGCNAGNVGCRATQG